MATDQMLTGKQRTFGTDEIIVTKTDLSGKITYANDSFVSISGYSERELLGSPHSLIRHPDMPRAIFKLLWTRLKAGQELFAYVVNRCKNGDHYWVLAHTTANFDAQGQPIGYHSSRRAPGEQAVNAIGLLYQELRRIETAGDRKDTLEASWAALPHLIARQGFSSYDRFIMSLVK